MHNRDITVLIDLPWFNVVHYSTLFQYFFSIYYGPYSSWKFLVYLFVKKTITMVMIVFCWEALLAGFCSLPCVHSVEAMSHCPHKFIINYFFDYSVCFIQVTDCSIRVSRSFTGGLQPPLPPRLLCLWFWLRLKYNIVAQPYYCHAYRFETITPCVPLTYLLYEK